MVVVAVEVIEGGLGEGISSSSSSSSLIET
jgi:hypothetical protein